jgi:pimeloyl-ACP methyl ester carboxylesterase
MNPQPEVTAVQVGDKRMTAARFGANPPAIVMLHDGLGSIAQWRDVPAKIAQATGVGVLAYDRSGHGESTPAMPSPIDWLHTEATALADLLNALRISKPLIVGHSDGGSIALLHAANRGTCAGVVTLAAHSFVEEVCVEKITAMRVDSESLVLGLAKYHSSPRQLFDSWSGVWTDREFASWDIRPLLDRIACPVLVVQGEDDEYATDKQLTETVASIGLNATTMRLRGAGHVIHHRAPETVVGIVAKFHQQLDQ